MITEADLDDDHIEVKDVRKLHADRGRSGGDRRKTCRSNSERAGVSSVMKWVRWFLPVLCFVSSCASPPENPSLPVLFARQVNKAEKDYDETLFLSYRKDGLLSAPVTLGKETRRSLTPPVPSRLTFTIPIPAEPLLSFSIGISTLGEQTLVQPVRFTIYVDEDIAFEETVRNQPNIWLPRTVDLSKWSGRTVRLGFQTVVRGRSPEGTGSAFLPAWGNPMLDGSPANEDGTNLVLISVDCLRADHVSTYGYAATSVSSWTLPTHMSMMTGLMPSLHGVSQKYKLSSSVPYLPEILADNGYQTFGVAAGDYVSQEWGFERGFDVYRMLIRRRAREIVDEALELVRGTRSAKKFLFVHLFDAHWPYVPPRGFLDRFDERPPDISDILTKVRDGVPPSGPEEIHQLVNLYDGEIAYLDQELGRFFAGLKEAGIYRRSLIILTADHGESFYEHNAWEHMSSLFEEVTHIPLIVKWPGESPTGTAESLVSQLNIFPTLLEESGFVPPYDHVSLARFLGESPAPSKNALSEFTWEQKNLLPETTADIGPLRSDARLLLEKARALQAKRRGQEVVLDKELSERLKALGYIN